MNVVAFLSLSNCLPSMHKLLKAMGKYRFHHYPQSGAHYCTHSHTHTHFGATLSLTHFDSMFVVTNQRSESDSWGFNYRGLCVKNGNDFFSFFSYPKQLVLLWWKKTMTNGFQTIANSFLWQVSQGMWREQCSIEQLPFLRPGHARMEFQ